MARGFKFAYGLEISPGRLALARASRRGAAQFLWAAAPDSEEARRALAAIAREVEEGRAFLAVAAPAAQTVVRRLRAPFASASKAAKVWPSLLDVDLPFPVEGAACCYGKPWNDRGGTAVLAAAIRIGDLEAFDGDGRAAGVSATHCDAEVLALWDQLAVEAPAARAGMPRVLVWLGPDHVAVARGRGAEWMAAHVLRASFPAGDSAGRPAFDALWSPRMRQILAAHLAETGTAEMDVWWAGPGAESEAGVAALRAALPAEFSLRHEILRQPSSFLARALARRAAAGSGANFKTGERAHPARVRAESRRLRCAYGAVIAASIAVLALNVGESGWRKRRIDAVQRQLASEAKAIVGDAVPYGQERLMVEREIVHRDAETQPFRTALDPVGLEGRLAAVLEAAKALDVEISRLRLSPAEIAIEGSAAVKQAVEGLVRRLDGQGWEISPDLPVRVIEGRQQFSLKGAGGHEG
ncbi:MAG: hypothetical protein AB7V14_09905 [Kiritimatiellia bacterium]